MFKKRAKKRKEYFYAGQGFSQCTSAERLSDITPNRFQPGSGRFLAHPAG
jgi:hypothetical protein